MKRTVVNIAIILAIVHQDFWNWSNSSLVMGFMPIGLFYHACFSLAAVALWIFAVKYAWPHKLEAWAEQGDEE